MILILENFNLAGAKFSKICFRGRLLKTVFCNFTNKSEKRRRVETTFFLSALLRSGFLLIADHLESKHQKAFITKKQNIFASPSNLRPNLFSLDKLILDPSSLQEKSNAFIDDIPLFFSLLCVFKR